MAKKKLYFLFITADKYPPFRVEITELFGRQLVSRGHVIDWLMQSQDHCSEPFVTTWDGGKVWVGPTNNGTFKLDRFRKHWLAVRNQMRVFELVRDNPYDFIQVKDKFLAAVLALLARWRYKKPFYFWLSFPYPEESLHRAQDGSARYPMLYLLRGHFLSWLLYKVIVPAADHVFVQSEQMKQDLMAQGARAEKLTPVSMGVSDELWEEFSRLEVAPPDLPGGPKVLYLGTLMRTRRLDMVVEAFDEVLKRVPDAWLYFVGDGSDPADRAMLESACEARGISGRVIFTGFLPRDEALAYVTAADVCLSPFYPSFILNSTSPTKIVEYMALGKAVVANDHPEQSLVIRESGAGLSVPWSAQAFADAIVNLLENPDTREEMGRLGRQYVRKHRVYSRIADTIEKRYLELAG